MLVLVLVTVLDFIQSSLFLSCKVLFILWLKWLFLLFPFLLRVLWWGPHGKSRAGFSLGSGVGQLGVSARPLEWSPCSWRSPNGTETQGAGGREAQTLPPTNLCVDGGY